jgi:hypothetical protein
VSLKDSTSTLTRGRAPEFGYSRLWAQKLRGTHVFLFAEKDLIWVCETMGIMGFGVALFEAIFRRTPLDLSKNAAPKNHQKSNRKEHVGK